MGAAELAADYRSRYRVVALAGRRKDWTKRRPVAATPGKCNYVKLTGEKSICSIYQHEKNGVMAVISNLADTP